MSEVKPFVPLVVSPVVAAAMLATSKTRLYELLAAGELKSFKDGKLRKIVVKSIEEYIKRKQLGL
jgi:excisionase family DNA binding protein